MKRDQLALTAITIASIFLAAAGIYVGQSAITQDSTQSEIIQNSKPAKLTISK